MYKLILLFVSGTLCLAAQTGTTSTQPAGPACLSGPVTKGTLTVTCTLVDMTGTASGSDVPGIAGSVYLAVKAVSTDPAVIGATFTLTSNTGASPTPTATITQSSQVIVSPVAFSALAPAQSTNLTLSYLFLLQNQYVPTSIQVQEFKPSSSQTF